MRELRGWAVGAVVVVAGGCQAIAGLSDLDVVEGAAGGSTSSSTSTASDGSTSSTGADGGAAPTTSSTTSTGADGGGGQGGVGQGGEAGGGGQGGAGQGGEGGASTSISSASSSSSTGGGPCETFGDCGANEVCPLLLGDESCVPCDDPASCEACGYVAPFPGDPPPCPQFCATCEDDQRCAFSCDAGGQEPCGAATIFLASGAMDFVLTCTDAGCDGKTVRCGTDMGPLDAPRSGPHECRVRCTEPGSCAGLTLDCSGQSGRCVLDCASGACVDAQVVCGENECAICGDGNAAADFDPGSELASCGTTRQVACPPPP